MVHLLVLEEAKLSLGCVLHCEIHQIEKDKRRPHRPSALHVELVLQAIVLVLSSETCAEEETWRRVAYSPREGELGSNTVLLS